jgi:hypothetical protein
VDVSRSSRLETYRDTVIADFAADTFGNGNVPASGNLHACSGAIAPFEMCRRGLDAKAANGLIRQGAQTLNWGRGAVERRWLRARVETRPDFQEFALADELQQDAADLVMAAQVGEIRAQKDIAALAVDPLRYEGFQRLNTTLLKDFQYEIK